MYESVCSTMFGVGGGIVLQARSLLVFVPLCTASMEECAAEEPQGGRKHWQQATQVFVCLRLTV